MRHRLTYPLALEHAQRVLIKPVLRLESGHYRGIPIGQELALPFPQRSGIVGADVRD